ncbi:spore protease YyaC [Lysinibacillus sp. 54212]|uniref:spore protease YyaC n=1 Tax=Lysinibacillus sp. 54212 TaxID=3119829 RepID=UPI002FC8677D
MQQPSYLHYAIHYEKSGAVWQLSEIFLQHIPFHLPQLTFCCIGTDRSTGDALGPLVGSQLLTDYAFPFPVLGTLEKPVHALNLLETQVELETQNPRPFIVAIDACLGEEQSVGTIIVKDGALYPGRAVKKELPPIGDLSIKGVVNVGGFMETMVLQNTRLHVTNCISNTIARALTLSWQRYLLKNKQYSNDNPYNQNSRQQIGYSNFR